MAPQPISPPGMLADNLAHFVRMLRAAGLPVGPGHTISAARALGAVDTTDRSQFYWALHGTLVSAPEQRAIFDSAFRLFWRDPLGRDEALQALLSTSRMGESEPRERAPARLSPGTAPGYTGTTRTGEGEEITMRMAFSPSEVLRTKDFEQMSAEEVRQAREALRRLTPDLRPIRTRRFRPDPHGPGIDARRTLRASLRTGGYPMALRRRSHATRRPTLVAICDISGSMETYSRILLHFFHTLTNASERIHTFLFGTRLTNVTRLLRDQDVERAMERVGQTVLDWYGGTRIGAALRAFNLHWSRRLLAEGAVVLLVTDGLDREGASGIAFEARRLRKSCRRLIWLNPLLRFEEFAPRAAGIRALLPEVDEHRPVHNLASVEALARALGPACDPSGRSRLTRRHAVS